MRGGLDACVGVGGRGDGAAVKVGIGACGVRVWFRCESEGADQATAHTVALCMHDEMS